MYKQLHENKPEMELLIQTQVSFTGLPAYASHVALINNSHWTLHLSNTDSLSFY